MALIGQIGEFDSATDQWLSYKERLEQFIVANDVADEKHVPVLLSVIGGRTYELLRTLTALQRPAEKTFAQLCTILENPSIQTASDRRTFQVSQKTSTKG